MATTIGSLNIILSASADGVMSGLSKAQQMVSGFASNVGSMFGGVGTAFGALGGPAGLLVGGGAAAALGALADNFAKVAALADDLHDFADALGATAAGVMGLQTAAAIKGVGEGDLKTGLEKLNKTIGESLAGSKEASEAFRRLKLDGLALARLPLESAFGQVADAINGLGTAAERSQAVTSIFGKGAQGLLPLLSKGGSFFDQQAARVEAMGLVPSKQLADANEQVATLKVGFGQLADKAKQFLAKDFLAAVRGSMFDPGTFSPGPSEAAVEASKALRAQAVEAERTSFIYKSMFAGVLGEGVKWQQSLTKVFEGVTGEMSKQAEQATRSLMTPLDHVNERINQLRILPLGQGVFEQLLGKDLETLTGQADALTARVQALGRTTTTPARLADLATRGSSEAVAAAARHVLGPFGSQTSGINPDQRKQLDRANAELTQIRQAMDRLNEAMREVEPLQPLRAAD
jgi:hypothetical protein